MTRRTTKKPKGQKKGSSKPLPNLETVLRNLPLIRDDLFLGMQATNLYIVDQILEEMEHQLLAQYIEEERTPVQSAITVSALSQLWIFGLYELLRSWRARAENIIKFSESLEGKGGEERERLITARKRQIESAGAPSDNLVTRWPTFERAVSDAGFVVRLQSAIDGSEILFRRLSTLRVTLAKHEIPQQGGYALAPGYGRIDESNGSIYWQVLLGNHEVDMLSRREFAIDARRLSEDQSALVLPRPIQTQISKFPKVSYHLKRTKVTLKSGEQCGGVLVFWNKIVVAVLGQGKIPFAARDVVAVEHELEPQPEELRTENLQ